MLYATGQGVAADHVEAYKWLILAAAGGSEDSAEALVYLQKAMTAQQLREARRRAYSWRSRPVPDLAQEPPFDANPVSISAFIQP
jgi:TPR repeat protein